ncbi:MAG: ATP-binding protein [Myxococcales bacterium]|nr:ATP-binding protein [Myxococcales bacterium]
MSTAHPATPPDAQEDLEHLAERFAWLIRMRWVAVGTVGLVVGLALWRGIASQALPLLSVAMALGAVNVGWWSWWRRPSRRPTSVATLELSVFAQLLVDVLALAALLHWSDGVENPFAVLFVFHMALGGMLLRRRLAFGLAAVTAVVHLGTVIAETLGAIRHHPLLLEQGDPLAQTELDPYLRSPSLVAAYSLSYLLVLFGTVYFVQSVAEGRRAAERKGRDRERLAVSRERLARIGELSAGVAHSIRNPLHGLINCVDILEAQVPGDSTGRATLELMGEGLARIEVVTRRLLALTREQPLTRAPTDLGELAGDAVRLVSLRASARKVAFEVEHDGVVEAEVDANRLNEALVSVLDNAVDASAEGASIRIGVRAGDPARDRASITVEDSGSGIAADDLARVFDPFFTTKAIGEGTGLGLAIAKRILEEHGGAVEIESAPGRGTRVRLLVPAAAAADGARP